MAESARLPPVTRMGDAHALHTAGFDAEDESRKALAVRIVEYAKRGERDLEKLRVYALAGVY